MEIGVCEKCGSATVDGHCQICNPKKRSVQSYQVSQQTQVRLAVLYGIGIAIGFWILLSIISVILTMFMIPASASHMSSWIRNAIGALPFLVVIGSMCYALFKIHKKQGTSFMIVTIVSASIATAVPFLIIHFLLAVTM
jgi:hypothetical protein